MADTTAEKTTKQRSTSYTVMQALVDAGKSSVVSWTVMKKQKDDAGNELKEDGKVMKIEEEVTKVPTIGKPVCVVADAFVARLIGRFGEALMTFDHCFPKAIRHNAFFRLRVTSVMDELKRVYPNSTPANRRRFVINVGHIMSSIVATAIDDCSRTRNRSVSADLVETLCRFYERTALFPIASDKPDAKTAAEMYNSIAPVKTRETKAKKAAAEDDVAMADDPDDDVEEEEDDDGDDGDEVEEEEAPPPPPPAKKVKAPPPAKKRKLAVQPKVKKAAVTAAAVQQQPPAFEDDDDFGQTQAPEEAGFYE